MKNIFYLRRKYLPMERDFPFFIHKWVHRPTDKSREFLHCRDFWKIVYVVSGSGQLEINDRSCPIEAGSVLFIHPEDETTYRVESPSMTIYNVCFLPGFIAPRLDFLENDHHFFSIFAPGFSMSPELARIFYIQDSAKSLHGLFRSLLTEYRGTEVNRAELIRAMLVELLIRLQRLAVRNFLGDKSTNVVWMVRDYIDRHFSEKIDFEALAKHVGLSRSRLSSVFKTAAGHCISEEILSRRLTEAQRLLAATALPISQICFRCGFNDVSLFYRNFHRRLNTTPLMYRRNAGTSGTP